MRRDVKRLAPRIPIRVAADMMARGRLGPRGCERQHWAGVQLVAGIARCGGRREASSPLGACVCCCSTHSPSCVDPGQVLRAVRMDSGALEAGSEMAAGRRTADGRRRERNRKHVVPIDGGRGGGCSDQPLALAQLPRSTSGVSFLEETRKAWRAASNSWRCPSPGSDCRDTLATGHFLRVRRRQALQQGDERYCALR